jgi:hypothetical protein
MDIVYVYQRKRKEFGRHCHFSDRPAEVIVDVSPDETLREQFIEKDVCEIGNQNTKDFSEHEVLHSLALLVLQMSVLSVMYLSNSLCLLFFR